MEQPCAPALAEDSEGRFYGTTPQGGSTGVGAIYRLTADGTVALLSSFAGTNGTYPQGTCLSLTSQMLSIRPENGGWRIRFAGVPEQTYELFRALDPSGPWRSMFQIVTGSDGLGECLNPAAPEERAFFRASP